MKTLLRKTQGAGDHQPAALNSPEVLEQYAKVSGVPMPSSPDEFVVYLKQDQAKWGAVIKAIGFKAE